MKTHEQWRQEYGADKMLPRAKRKLSFSSGDLVRAIQLDSVKDGLLRAAHIISEREHRLERNGAKELVREHYHQQAILEYADKLTEKDIV